MNVPYLVPLKIANDALVFPLLVSHQKHIGLGITTGVYAQITPHYEGDYIVTPTESTQVLHTDGLIMDDDVTVNPIPSRYHDTSDATIVSGDLLNGAVGYGVDGKVVGSIPVNGSTGGEITTKAQVVTIPNGYTTGGNVSISAAEQANIDSNYILGGHSILGVNGLSANVNTSDATANENYIAYPYTAYVNGAKVTGNLMDGDAMGFGNGGIVPIVGVGQADYMVI